MWYYLEFSEILQELKKNIYIVELPPKLMGLTLPNYTIIPKKIASETNEGSAFIIFLHELAHLLQRISCACFVLDEAILINGKHIAGPVLVGGRVESIISNIQFKLGQNFYSQKDWVCGFHPLLDNLCK